MLHPALLLALALAESTEASDLRALELELEAARTRSFYLVVDVPAATLSLGLGGVELKRYAVVSLAAGARLLARPSDDVLLRLSECRRVSPREVPVIRPGAPILDEPPPGDELPSRGFVDCGANLSLLITSQARALRDALRGVEEPNASLRLRAVLAEEDVHTLFEVLPDRFLVLFVLR